MILERLVVVLTADVSGLENGLKSADGKLAAVGRTAVGVGKGLAAVGVAAVAGSVGLAKLTQAGGRSIQLQTAFANRVGDVEVALAQLRRETLGLVSDTELLQQANQSLALGASRTVAEFGELASVSLSLSRALGIDATFALQSLNTGIARQSKLYLDNLGIIISVEEANEAYAKSIGKTVKQLSDAEKREAFRAAALKEARSLVESFGEQSETAADSVDRLAASLANALSTLARFIATRPSVKSFFDGLNDIVVEATNNWRALFMGVSPEALAELERLRARSAATPPGTAGATALRQQGTGFAIEMLDLQERMRGLESRRTQLEASPYVSRAKTTELFEIGQELESLQGRENFLREALEILNAALPRLRGEVGKLGDDADGAGDGVGALEKRIKALGGIGEPALGRNVVVPGMGVVPFDVVAELYGGQRYDNMSGIGRAQIVGRSRVAGGDFANIWETTGGSSPAEVAASFGEITALSGELTDSLGDTSTAFGKFTRQLLDKFGLSQIDATEMMSNIGANLISGGISAVASKAFSAVQGMFTTSPEERERRRVMEANNMQLARLNDGIARLSTALLGEQASEVTKIATALEATPLFGFGVGRGIFEDELRKVGLTFEDAQRVARGFGIELTGSTDSLIAFKKALRTEWLDQITRDFGTGFDLMMREFRILGTSPEDQFNAVRERILGPLTQGNPFDLINNPLARGAMTLTAENFDAFAQDFFRRLREGDETLFDDLGDLSVDDFIGFLEFAGDSLKGLGDVAQDVADQFLNVPQGFKIAKAIFDASDAMLPPGFGPTDQGGTGGLPPTGFGGPGTNPFGGGVVVQGDVVIQANSEAEGAAAWRGVQREVMRQSRRGGPTDVGLSVTPR